MKKILTIAFASVTLLLAACTKPTEGLELIIDTDIIKTNVLIHVFNGADGDIAPVGTTMKVSSDHINEIYEVSGKKDIVLVNGITSFGVDPKLALSESNPVKVTVDISAPGYKKVVQQVIFNGSVKHQVLEIPLMKPQDTKPPVILPLLPVFQNISLSFRGQCQKRPDMILTPSVYVFFKESGSGGPFRYMGYVEKGKILTPYLELNQTYDFQINYGNQTHKVSQKIEQLSYDLTVDMGQACDLF